MNNPIKHALDQLEVDFILENVTKEEGYQWIEEFCVEVENGQIGYVFWKDELEREHYDYLGVKLN